MEKLAGGIRSRLAASGDGPYRSGGLRGDGRDNNEANRVAQVHLGSNSMASIWREEQRRWRDKGVRAQRHWLVQPQDRRCANSMRPEYTASGRNATICAGSSGPAPI